MKLPRTLAVMILPGAVLFPGAMLPLYIFEPRYRRMLADALREDRMFAIGLEKPGEDEGVFPVGGAGFIRACVAHDDGTSRLILQGVSRVRFVAWLPGNPYRTAVVEPLPTTTSQPLVSTSLRREVRDLCGSLLGKKGASMLRLFDSATDDAEFGDFVGSHLVEDAVIRQRLLEENDVSRRLEILAAYLTSVRASN